MPTHTLFSMIDTYNRTIPLQPFSPPLPLGPPPEIPELPKPLPLIVVTSRPVLVVGPGTTSIAPVDLSRRERGAHRLRVVRIFEVAAEGELGEETDAGERLQVRRMGVEGGSGIRAIARGMGDDDNP